MTAFSRQFLYIFLMLVPVVACGKSEQRFESVCQIVRRDVVERDEKGVPVILDLELEWDPCPGDQFQVVRAGEQFAACMDRYEDGARVPVLVKQWWDNRGYYTWDIYKVGDCTRAIEPESEGSYEKSQECREQVMYGDRTGFVCSRRPFAQLLATCPWMARN